jgi:hypothetical protein
MFARIEYGKYIKCLLVKKIEVGNAVLVLLRSVLFHLDDAKSDVVNFCRF